ncbi:pyridoxamine 5'-phosphate oxidase family protein [Hyphococcus luteus]|uniref:Pyridoxamine 5'-phosphate oxidase n=1 Tax=Hyphococcus luteus TaxID=2058213 RepID=A0A2S7K6X2_9PROT|nr:pyridoxamine 5'-phosphate oxidase family protein [Marinicaulis flavus]PQA88226.1 pyridoxamine 5'-phosphate oxidase [Marinicaulis flavus]
MTAAFTSIVRTNSELQEILGEPPAPVVMKTLSALDRHCRAFIAKSPFVLVASSDSEGRMDISPKGDPPGFVQVLDDKTLAIPDRPGNRRADTFHNLLDNPHVGLIFLIPGKKETLRVSGLAEIVRDESLRESMAVNGKTPDLALVIRVEEAFFHCAKCVTRSKLWRPDDWPSLEGLPTLAETMIDAAKIDAPADAVQAIIDEDEKERLY